MNPHVKNITETDYDLLQFTLEGVNVSIANAIRRALLSDIPTTVIRTETAQENQCEITINTSRLHNEILKQRLGSIPIYNLGNIQLPGAYEVRVDVENNTDNIVYVTTEDFRIWDKAKMVYLSDEDAHTIFPPNKFTGQYIDFARLRPKICDTIPGEHIQLKADFSVATAKESGMFNVVSKSSYCYTIDEKAAEEAWKQVETKLSKESSSAKLDIAFEKRNFELLDASRYYIENSFDFVVQTVGVYPSKKLVQMALRVLQDKFEKVVENINTQTIAVVPSESVAEFSMMENSWDIVLENEDYTIGKVLEFLLYEKYWLETKILSFCGFRKFHPHNVKSHLRLAFLQKATVENVRDMIIEVANQAGDIFNKIKI